jgi:hypothetical protein
MPMESTPIDLAFGYTVSSGGVLLACAVAVEFHHPLHCADPQYRDVFRHRAAEQQEG